MYVDKDTFDAARKFGWAIAETLLKKKTKSTSVVDIFSSVSSVNDFIEALNKAAQVIEVNGMVPAGLQHLENKIPTLTNEQAVAISRIIAMEGYRVLATKKYINPNEQDDGGDDQ